MNIRWVNKRNSVRFKEGYVAFNRVDILQFEYLLFHRLTNLFLKGVCDGNESHRRRCRITVDLVQANQNDGAEDFRVLTEHTVSIDQQSKRKLERCDWPERSTLGTFEHFQWCGHIWGAIRPTAIIAGASDLHGAQHRTCDKKMDPDWEGRRRRGARQFK